MLRLTYNSMIKTMEENWTSGVCDIEIEYQVYSMSNFSSRKLLRFVFGVFISKLNNLIENLASL